MIRSLKHFFIQKLEKYFKNSRFSIFHSNHFFLLESKEFFTRPRRERQRQAERQRKIFWIWLLFWCILTWKSDPNLKISIFEKLFNLIIFLEHVSDLNRGLFSSNGSKNLIQYRSKIVLKCILRILWHSWNFVVKRTLKYQKLHIYVESSKWAEGHQKRNV